MKLYKIAWEIRHHREVARTTHALRQYFEKRKKKGNCDHTIYCGRRVAACTRATWGNCRCAFQVFPGVLRTRPGRHVYARND